MEKIRKRRRDGKEREGKIKGGTKGKRNKLNEKLSKRYKQGEGRKGGRREGERTFYTDTKIKERSRITKRKYTKRG